jgi:hypothetical protein
MISGEWFLRARTRVNQEAAKVGYFETAVKNCT